jgi:hypothetical protein
VWQPDKHDPNEVLHARLRALLKAVRGWVGRRNDVAHGKIAGAPNNLNHCALWPAQSNARKNAVDHRAAYVYNAVQIKEFGSRFMDLHDSLLDYFSELRHWRLERLGVHQPQYHWLTYPETEDQSDPQ